MIACDCLWLVTALLIWLQAIPESVVWVAKTVCLVVLVVAVLAALVVWLMRLSDYMNQRDARRPRARFRY